MTFEELNDYVIAWAQDKGIIASTSDQVTAQLGKTLEEVDEFAQAAREYLHVCQYDSVTSPMNGLQERLKNEASLELGDVLVTVIVAAACAGLDPTDALQRAYIKIKSRTGRTVDGVFVKD